MESLSRPPHRRKHSTATNASPTSSSLSLKNPYDDVSFSKGGKAKFGAREYAEIFSSSSSIPVLDFSGMDERVGSDDYRSSKLDYSNIFGGFRGDDVAVSYEELVNGAQKKTKTRIPSDAQSPYQESVYLHSSGKNKKPSIDASDQSISEIKQNFSMSFNMTRPTNFDASNGTHIAQLHAVPGFTYFVDGTYCQSEPEGERDSHTMKSEVSRTWSFSAGVEEVTVKSRFIYENTYVPDKSCNLNEIKHDSHISQAPPCLFAEESDENSVAAMSAAALKRAIEQAQESIRIAKMIMERKKVGPLDGSIRRSKGRSRKDKKKIGVDGEAETVRENVGVAKEHGDASTKVGRKFVAEKINSENVGQNVEAGEACRDKTNFTGLVANAECETVSPLESQKVDGNDNLICSMNKHVSHPEEMKSGLEKCRSTVGQTEPENIAELMERVVNCSPSTQKQEKTTGKAGKNLRIGEKDEVNEEGADEEVVNGELTELKEDLSNDFLNKSRSPGEKYILEQEDTEMIYENVPDFEKGRRHGKSTKEELSEIEPEIFPGSGKKVNEVNEPEIDEKNLNFGYDENGQKIREEYEQNDVSERHLEENRDKFVFREAVSGKDNDEAVCAYSYGSGISDTRSTGTDSIFSETQEHYDVKTEQYEAKYYKENDDIFLGGTETFPDKEVNEMSGTDSLRRCASEEIFIGISLNDGSGGLSSDSNTGNVGLMDGHDEQPLPEDEAHNEAAKFDHADITGGTLEIKEGSIPTHRSQGYAENAKESTSRSRKPKIDVDMTSDERECVNVQDGRVYSEDQTEEVYSQSNHEPKEMDNSIETDENLKKNKENFMEQKDSKENEQNIEIADQQRRIEAIKRGREREKDRIVVERAMQEARERAFVEARERTERERARQRVKAEARGKGADKASIDAKVRAERAAVERATAEARARALEKARSQKTSTEMLYSSSKSNGLKHSFSSSDLEKFDGTTNESAQRRKARLERHQRIMERAAKALAEKNMRDSLVQKEQTERNRIAAFLDADIKRWATGKEGNLRALLSTLQYILGPGSGWQPTPLTEIITSAAVKKVYRKATLCVHPDKVQQRGASIQQKYICEKVFDLLKAAWNRFNSEES